MSKGVAKPFLKWAGGKSQHLDKFREMYPTDFKIYIEPFVGGGAVLFDILQRFTLDKAVIIDLNKELINCYRCIKQDVEEIIKQLEQLKSEFISLNAAGQEKFYLDIRKRYNETVLNREHDFEKAANFIFLNKTCFNGLYRVNSKGEFNVPFAKSKNPSVYDRENLTLVSKLLQNVTIIHGDYKQCLDYIGEGTFVYCDPPYRPLSASASFVGYSQNGFNDDDQREVASFIKKLSERGCLVMLSGADPKNADPEDSFLDELYNGFDIMRINARRMINCRADKRGNITEIVVRNYLSH